MVNTPTSLPELALRSYSGAWNRAHWEQLPADGNIYEVIDGELYMTTAPSPFHQQIIRQLARVLLAAIDDRGVGETLWSPIGVFMPGCDPVQPDLLVVQAADRAIIQDWGIEGVPSLMIEVLSPSNPTSDTQIKRGAYARAGVPEYWIVRPTTRDILVGSQPDTAMGDYTQSVLVDYDAILVSPTLPIQTPVAVCFPPDPTP